MSLAIPHKFIHPITCHFRKRRGAILKQTFPDVEKYRICDIGGSAHFWEKTGLKVNPDNITIYNISETEAGSININENNKYNIIIYDGNKIPENDYSYDLVLCNSVIEHVPVSQRQSLINEIRRVGKNLFLQTPAYEFPIEPHFIMPFMHWFPRNVGRYLASISIWRILSRPEKKTIDNYFWGTKLLNSSDINRLLFDCTIIKEKFFGLTKSYIVICKRN